MSETKEKVIGFRIPENDEKRLKKDLHRQETTRKEWLDKYLTISESIHELSVKQNEKWIRVPASEYEALIKNSPEHGHVIYQRIFQHCMSQGIEITFENLFQEIKVFMKMNDMELKKTENKDVKTLQMNHGIGINYSKFCLTMLKDMIEKTNEFVIIEETLEEFGLEIKLKNS